MIEAQLIEAVERLTSRVEAIDERLSSVTDEKAKERTDTGTMSALVKFERTLSGLVQDVSSLEDRNTVLRQDLEEMQGDIQQALDTSGGQTETIEGRNHIRVFRNGGVTIIEDVTLLEGYELYQIAADLSLKTVYVRDNPYGLWIDGELVAVTAGTAGFDTAITLSAASIIYIKYDRTGGGATLEVGAEMGTPDSETRYFPLWAIGWDTTVGTINLGAILDARYSQVAVFPLDVDSARSIDQYSLEMRTVGGYDIGQLYKFDELTTTVSALADGDHILCRQVPGTATKLVYATRDALVDWIEAVFDCSNTTTWLTDLGSWWETYAPASHPHSQHSDFNTDDHDDSTSYPYVSCASDATETRNSMNAAAYIGDGNSPAKRTIHPHGRKLFDSDGSTATVDWGELKLYDAAATSKLAVDWGVRKAYDADGTTVTVDWDAMKLTGGLWNVGASGDAQDMKVWGTTAATNDSTGALVVVGDIATAGALWAGTEVIADSRFNIGGGNGGQSVTNNFMGGILVNANATFKRAGDLSPDDYVMVGSAP